ncbi:unnamed protein product, partial [marine sediment metagenome]
AERVKDVIDWRSKRAKTIVKAIENLDFRIAILSSAQYVLDGYEIIRLVNIIYTSKRVGRSLRGLEASIRRQDYIEENQLAIIKGEKKLPH